MLCVLQKGHSFSYRLYRRIYAAPLPTERIRGMLISTNLLDGALGTAFFERLLGFFDFTLRLAREDGERHVGDGILRFLQAQVGEATHNLNDRDALIGVNVVNDKVELGLFFGGFATGSRAGGHHHAARRSGGVDAEHFFDLSDELGRFKELRARERSRFYRQSSFRVASRHLSRVPRAFPSVRASSVFRVSPDPYRVGSSARRVIIIAPPTPRPRAIARAARTVSVFISSMIASVFADARTTDVRFAAVGRTDVGCARDIVVRGQSSDSRRRVSARRVGRPTRRECVVRILSHRARASARDARRVGASRRTRRTLEALLANAGAALTRAAAAEIVNADMS